MDQINQIFNASAEISNVKSSNQPKAKLLSSTDKKCNDLFKSFLLGFAAGGFTGAGAGTGLTAATAGAGFIAIPILTTVGAVVGGIAGIVTHLFYDAVVKNEGVVNKGNDSTASNLNNLAKTKIADLIIKPNEKLEDDFVEDLKRGSYIVNEKEYGVTKDTFLTTKEAQTNKSLIQYMLFDKTDISKHNNKIENASENIIRDDEIKNESNHSMINLMSIAGQKLPTAMKDIIEEKARDKKTGELTKEYQDILDKYSLPVGFYGTPGNIQVNINIDLEKITYSVKASIPFALPTWGDPVIDHYMDFNAKITIPLNVLSKRHEEDDKKALLSQIKINELIFNKRNA
ncbi:MAG: hypothetical protein Q8K60_02160 [Parachlamydiaceae bacterium]|nr:hypothetical protein [Parachlamydiaceae bacterium]